MAEWIYTLCALTAAGSATLLLRAYARSKSRLLLWSGLCFVGLALNNTLLVLDQTILDTTHDLSTVRLVPALIGMCLLLYGLIWEGE
jgi:hypothetical protein